MNTINDQPAILIASSEDVAEIEAAKQTEQEEVTKAAYGENERLQSSLASHILNVFQKNIDARQTSGIEEKMLQSLRAYNGNYDPEDLAKIRMMKGSEIYMNLTPTKCRAAMSWIRDIMLPANENSWLLEPSPLPDIPEEIKDKIREQIDSFMEALKAQDKADNEQQAQAAQQAQQPQQAPPPQKGQPQGQPQQAPQQAPQAPQPDKNALATASRLKDANDLQRDFEDAYNDEVYKLAKQELKKYEVIIADQLAEGGWDIALSNFIEDFCVFPVAIMKGPIITKRDRIVWEGGSPVQKKDFIFLNKRVSPLDIYPGPSSTGVNDGNLCEHIRLHRDELFNLIGVPHYKDSIIREILVSGGTASLYSFLNTHIEDEKTTEEFRGDTYRANEDVFHGVHYFGTASKQDLLDFGVPEEDLSGDEAAIYQVEALMVGDKIIKAVINDDPLLRRPYYKASFQNIPGSWWGRSLPELMRDVQRMCNATARALANNIGIASGPQIELYIDRLAADENTEDIYPFRTWQATSDPGGGSGRAVNFWQPTSNANELLLVYKEFEVRADDATGIPRYAYGNERTGGAAQTASGLSMLLESASKGIKDAIRHIDDGLIKPRIDYQFYWNMLTRPDKSFSGDVVVVPKGSQALTMRGAQEMRRNEFLQILANPEYMKIVGVEGIAEILREMAKALGLGENIIPSRIELKWQQKRAEQQQAEMMKQQQQMEQEKGAVGIKQVEMQTSQADQANQRKVQVDMAKIQQDDKKEQNRLALEIEKLKAEQMKLERKIQADLSKQQIDAAQKDRTTNKNIALSVKSGFRDKSNEQ